MTRGERPSTAAEEGPAWSATAALWDEHWARLAAPAREVVLEQAAVGPMTRFLDMGCGTGELCRLAADRGATVSGIDAAEGMIDRARARLPQADLRLGAIENLPWDDGPFDVVTGFNSFQFAAERLDGFREARRVVGPQPDAGEEPDADPAPAFGYPGVLEGLAADAGLTVVATGDVDVPYETRDLAQLQGALEFDLIQSGSSDTVDRPEFGDAVETAAAPRRRDDGSYRFHNTYRWLLAAV